LRHRSGTTVSPEPRYKPKGFSKSDDQEIQGNLLLQNLVKDEPLVKLLLAGNDKTSNRDGFIELRDTNNVVGNLVVQVKPVNSQRKKSPCYQLPKHLVGYSQVSGLPFILICYDLSTQKAYWKKIDDSQFEHVSVTQKSVSVPFKDEDRIGPGFPYLTKWQEISTKHLAACELGPKFQHAYSIIQGCHQSENVGLSNLPLDLAGLIQQILETATENIRVRLLEAKKLLKANEPVAATRILEQLQSEIVSREYSPDLVLNLHLCLGSCYTRLENEEMAEASFRKALQISPNSARAQSNLAHVLFIRRKDTGSALKLAETAYRHQPTDDFSAAIYILCLGRAGHLKKIKALVAKHHDYFRDSSFCQMALAQDLRGRGELEKSLPFFDRCISLQPENIHARILRAGTILHILQDEFPTPFHILASPEKCLLPLKFVEQEASAAIEALVSNSDRHALMRAFEICALANVFRNKHRQAISYCDKIVAIMPAYIQAYEIKGRSLFELSKDKEALEALLPVRECLRKGGKQTLAYASYRLKKYGEAANYFDSYIQLTDTDREWFLYAESLWLSGNCELAAKKARELRDAGRLTVELEKDLTLLGCTVQD